MIDVDRLMWSVAEGLYTSNPINHYWSRAGERTLCRREFGPGRRRTHPTLVESRRINCQECLIELAAYLLANEYGDP